MVPRQRQFEVPDFTQRRNYISSNTLQPSGTRSLLFSRFWKSLGSTEGGSMINDFNFQTSRHRFEDANNDWQPYRLLGSGGFGVVGAWVKKNDQNEIIDEVAIKEIRSEKLTDPGVFDILLWDPQNNNHLLYEAVVQRQLNLSNCENLIHLRAFKSFIVDAEDHLQDKKRFYMELAPYGDLNALRCRYRYYNQFLPEAFLWHVFDSLAASAEVMFQCSRTGLAQGRTVRSSDSVVDFDLKATNIFLSYADHRTDGSSYGGTRRYDYPVVKLGDLGQAFFTGPRRRGNPVRCWGWGTRFSRPPEQIHYGIHWGPFAPNGFYEGILNFDDISGFNPECRTDPPQGFDTTDPDNFSFKFSEKLNVWAIGMVLYELMSLGDSREYWEETTTSYTEFNANGHRQIADFNQIPFRHAAARTSPYSRELTKLVDDCLTPSQSDRIELGDLRASTQAGMALCDGQYSDNCEVTNADSATRGVNHPKLYWRGDELNNLPEGQESFPQDWSDYANMQDVHNYDPEYSSISPPFHRNAGLSATTLATGVNHSGEWKNARVGGMQNIVKHHFNVIDNNIYARSNPPSTDSDDSSSGHDPGDGPGDDPDDNPDDSPDDNPDDDPNDDPNDKLGDNPGNFQPDEDKVAQRQFGTVAELQAARRAQREGLLGRPPSPLRPGNSQVSVLSDYHSETSIVDNVPVPATGNIPGLPPAVSQPTSSSSLSPPPTSSLNPPPSSSSSSGVLILSPPYRRLSHSLRSRRVSYDALKPGHRPPRRPRRHGPRANAGNTVANRPAGVRRRKRRGHGWTRRKGGR